MCLPRLRRQHGGGHARGDAAGRAGEDAHADLAGEDLWVADRDLGGLAGVEAERVDQPLDGGGASRGGQGQGKGGGEQAGLKETR
jgi:hypothetical protein